ncbi:MAG: GAF domain-containing protein, partial [Candidatus Omnitrophica bacterium]|nr:GAF domain-containing protein [Candidatus Omnitrophota bacterium]
MKRHTFLPFISKGLNYKLKVAFYLMANAPLVVCIYIILRYIYPQSGAELDIRIPIVILIMIVISNIGFFILKRIFDHIVFISKKAELIASGDTSYHIDLKRDDELGDLGNALNQLTGRIRMNMEELKNYSQRTAELNLEIQKRIYVFSSLLQISSLISQGANLDNILKLITEKARLLTDSDVAYMLFQSDISETFQMRAVDGVGAQDLLRIKLEPDENFYKVIGTYKQLILDQENILSEDIKKYFKETFKLKNALALPIFLKGKIKAILGVGNNRDEFLYKKDDIELLDIFAKQTAIAIENDMLTHRIEKLEIKDTLTGLYNETFIYNRLQEEIRRAIIYQR